MPGDYVKGLEVTNPAPYLVPIVFLVSRQTSRLLRALVQNGLLIVLSLPCL